MAPTQADADREAVVGLQGIGEIVTAADDAVGTIVAAIDIDHHLDAVDGMVVAVVEEITAMGEIDGKLASLGRNGIEDQLGLGGGRVDGDNLFARSEEIQKAKTKNQKGERLSRCVNV